MKIIHFLVYVCLLGTSNYLCGQLENPIFNGTFNHIDIRLDSSLKYMKLKKEPDQLSIQALHYLKNNEYMEKSNPGETLFGLQLSMGTLKYVASNRTKLYVGAMVNIPYGENTSMKFYPIVQFQHQISPQQYLILGSIHGNTKHRLYEPLYNYELSLNRPVEYGLQHLFQGDRFQSDIWLNWRQQVETKNSTQEIISFGANAEYHLNPNQSKYKLSIPTSNLLYHKGGESLLQGKPIQNQWNGSIGLKYQHSHLFTFESILFGAFDFSPQLTHSFKDGHALLNQLSFNVGNSQKWALSHYYAEEFYSPFAPNLFLSEQLNKPYNFENYRNFLMLRYQWMHQLIPDYCVVDFRIEPIWHIEKSQLAFSAGFYLKYVIGSEIH